MELGVKNETQTEGFTIRWKFLFQSANKKH